MGQSATIEIESPTREVFERYVATRTPVIVRGAAADWPALERWSAEHFRREGSAGPVPVDVFPRGDFFDRGGPLGRVRKIEIPLSEYVDRALADGETRYYAPDLELSTHCPALERDVRVPSFFAPPHRRFLFMGRDTMTALHFHAYRHAFTCQVTGEKELTLYSPEDTRHLYPHPWFAPAASWSPVDFSDPSPKRHPALSRARAHTAHLTPGDGIFIPIHWWHWVKGVGFSASVLLSWRAPVRQWHFPETALRSACSAVLWEPVRIASTLARRIARRGRD